MTKSIGNCVFGHITEEILMENFIFVQGWFKVIKMVLGTNFGESEQ